MKTQKKRFLKKSTPEILLMPGLAAAQRVLLAGVLHASDFAF